MTIKIPVSLHHQKSPLLTLCLCFLFSLSQNLVKTLELGHDKKFRFLFLLKVMKKLCLHVFLGVPTGSKTDHIPTVNWDWSVLFVRMLSKLSKSNQTQRIVYSIKQTLKYSLWRETFLLLTVIFQFSPQYG